MNIIGFDATCLMRFELDFPIFQEIVLLVIIEYRLAVWESGENL
jgi:hypothetical protein